MDRFAEVCPKPAKYSDGVPPLGITGSRTANTIFAAN